MIMPLTQYAHWPACSSMNARCRGCGAPGVPSPSSVSTVAPSGTVDRAVTHERLMAPSTSTVHAPHCDTPQPNFGPCWSSAFRKT